MTHYDTYAGILKDRSFDWRDPSAELSRGDIQILTPSFWDHDSFFRVWEKIRDGGVPFKKLDWGSWAIPASKSDILAIMAGWKVGWDLPDPGDETHKPRLQRAKCLEAVNGFDPAGEYLVLIEEF